MAAPFDLSNLKITGAAVAVIPEVMEAPRSGAAQFGFSRKGALVYVGGGMEGSRRKLVLVNRDGAPQPLPVPPRPYISPRFSPDGKQIAVATEEVNFAIWIYDVASQKMAQLNTGMSSAFPIWTPDGKRVAFRASSQGSPGNIF